MSKRLVVTSVLAGSVGLVSSGTAAAQQGGESSILEEVMVTAQKRSQNLQNVPISITALGGGVLDQLNSVNIGDFARRVPGLSFRSTGPGENEVVVRGIASSDGSLRQTTGYYLDETPLSAVGMGAIDAGLFDLERIEVLRGPQGTLYGSGSMGGTVRLITTKPDFHEFSVGGDVSVADTKGGAMSHAVSAGINLPFSDRVALRASGYSRDDGGWIERASRLRTFNPYVPAQYQADPDSPIQHDVNDQQTRGARAALAWQLTDSLLLTPSVFHQNIKTDSRPEYDQPPGHSGYQIQTRMFPEWIDDTFTLSNLTAKYSGASFELLSSTSYFDRDRTDLEDISTVPLFFFYPAQTSLLESQYTTDVGTHSFVEELRFATTGGGPLNLIAGVFYSDSTTLASTLSVGPGFSEVVFPIEDDLFSEGFRRLKTQEQAVFGEISYQLLENLTATVGARAFKSKISAEGYRGGFAVGGGRQLEPRTTAEESGVNPKFLLSWQATPSALVYATAAEGFRPGGVNGAFPIAFCGEDLEALGLSEPPEEYQADKLWNYELGSKTRWLENRLTVNGAVYFIDWKEVQQQASLACGFGFLGNFGSAESKGVELEVSARIGEGLTLSSGASYNEATLTGGGLPGLAGEPGDPLQNAPKWTVNASADYAWSFGAGYDGGVTLNYQYTSEVFGSFDPTYPDYHRPGYSVVQMNARLATSRYEYSLFVNNLTNTEAQTAFAGSAALETPGVRVAVPIRPRTIGLKLAVKF